MVLRTFLDAKSSKTVLRSIVSKISLWMVHIVNPFNLSYDIVDLKQFFNNFNFEKLLSAEATVTGTVKMIR